MITRTQYPELLNHLEKPEITLLTGPRQVGKTTLLKMLEKEKRNAGTRTLFFNLDNESHQKIFFSQEDFLARARLEFGSDYGIIFIDEIQRKENAGLFLKGLYDMELPWKLVVSGSGSLELKGKINESLVGRKRLFELLPVTIEEFLDYRTAYKYSGSLDEWCRLEYGNSKQLLTEYLNFGGYPRLITTETMEGKQQEMDEIYHSYLEKDIVYLLGVSKPEAFRKMLGLLAVQLGCPVNYSNLAKLSNLSIPTLKEYLDYAEKTFVIRTIAPFTNNKTKEITRSSQAYFFDNGFRNYALNRMGSLQEPYDLSFVFQGMVYWMLKDKLRWTVSNLHYWRTADGAEIDIVIDSGQKVIPVEVKFSEINKAEIPRSMRSFINAYKPSDAYIINLGYEHMATIYGTRVHWLPWYRINEIITEMHKG